MGIFGSGNKTTATTTQSAYQGIPVNNSEYGNVIPVAIGPNRCSPHIIWAGDWKNTPTTTPGTKVGKGLGGGTTPGSTTNNYSEAMQMALAYGPLDRLDSIWVSNGKVGVTQISASYTVPMGGGALTVNDAAFVGDYGVGAQRTYSQSVNDFGSPGSRTLSGTYLQALTKGSVSAPGVYVLTTPSPGVNVYTFNTADAGTTVQISYSSLLGTIYNSEELVLASTTFTVPDTSTFWGPNSATQVIDQGTGNSFTLIASGTPTTGQFKVTGTPGTPGGGVFTLASADIGKTLLFKWQSQDTTVDVTHALLNYSISNGVQGQSPWSYLSSTHPDQALGYSNIALWNWPDMSLGTSNAVPQFSAEGVFTQYMAGGGIAGANPADVIQAILCDSVWGVGLDPSLLGDWSNARAFWAANNFFISGYWDTQTTGMDEIKKILDAGQAVMFWDQGLLQLAVYGDTSIAGNGSIYQPDTQPVVELDITDLVAAGGKEPVKIETEATNNVFNVVKVEWKNNLVDYNTDMVTEEDSASIAQNGRFEEGQQSWDFIRYVAQAQWAANLRLKRITNIRDTYTFSVPTRYRPLLRLMKLITITWNHMGWNQKPLRIIKIEDSHEGLNLTLEEFPYGTGTATLYPKLTAQAQNQNPSLISPGDTDLVAVLIPDGLNNFAGRTIRIYADPVTPENWGGSNIYFSGDNSEFTALGMITAPVMMGTLGGSGMTVGTGDPDTQTITVVDTNAVPLESASSYDFGNGLALLAIIDVSGSYEIVAYQNATLTGAATYHVQNFHRGLFGTTRASHSSGATVIEMGEAFLDFQWSPDQDNQTVYFRAASFNKLQARLQDVSTLSSLSVVLNPTNPGLFTNGNINVTVPASKTIFASSATVESLKPAEAGAQVTTGKPIDILADGTNFYRTPSGIVLTGDIPYNGDFETFSSTQVVAEGWTKDFEHTGSGYSYARSGTAFSGNYSQAITNTSSAGAGIASRPFSVKGGVTYQFGCRVQCNHTSTNSIYVRILWYSNDTQMTRGGSSEISTNDAMAAGSVTTANTWQQVTGTAQAPANAVFARIAIYNWTSATPSTVLFDRVFGQLNTIAMNAVGDDPGTGRYAGSTAGGNTDGYQILTNPEFASGSLTGYNVYDNNATGHVTISAVTDTTAPNTSGYKMQIAVAAGGESPGLGGFYIGIPVDSGTFAVNTYHKGSTIIWRVRALIPTGHNIQFASNAYGTGGTYTWLTSQAGTGGWFEYVASQVIGTSGSFSSTGFWYVDGSASSPFNWYVAMCSGVNTSAPATININQSPRVQYLDPNSGQSPTSTMLNPQFSLLPGQSVAFTFAAETTSTLGFSWGTQTLTLPDSSTLSLAGSSHSFTGLSASTTYYAVAYLTRSGSTAIMNFLGPFAGSVTAAQVMPASLDGRAFLGVLHDTTTSSGTGPGGGEDPGGCPHEDTMAWVKPASLEAEPIRMRIGDVRHGDFIKGWDFGKMMDVYREVKSFHHHPGTMWFRVGGYLCTALETIFITEWMPAYKAPGATKVRGLHGNRVEIRLDAHLPVEQRNYWLDNGEDAPLLMHNFILPRS